MLCLLSIFSLLLPFILPVYVSLSLTGFFPCSRFLLYVFDLNYLPVHYSFKHNVLSLGPGCQTLCESTALLGAKWKIPLVSYGCFLESLWDLTLYPTLFKSLGTCHDLAHFIVSMVEFYKWTYVTTVITSDISRWKSIQEAIWVKWITFNIFFSDYFTFFML